MTKRKAKTGVFDLKALHQRVKDYICASTVDWSCDDGSGDVEAMGRRTGRDLALPNAAFVIGAHR